MRNVRQLLEEAGATLGDICKVAVYLTDHALPTLHPREVVGGAFIAPSDIAPSDEAVQSPSYGWFAGFVEQSKLARFAAQKNLGTTGLAGIESIRPLLT